MAEVSVAGKTGIQTVVQDVMTDRLSDDGNIPHLATGDAACSSRRAEFLLR